MMNDYSDWVEYIKESVSLHDVLNHYNIPQNMPGAKETQFNCPFHSLSGDSKPSARVYENGTGYCWGCGKAYDSISFVQQLEELKFTETLRFMERIFELKPFVLEREEKDKAPYASQIDEVFNTPKTLDPVLVLNSVNSLLTSNRDSLSLNVYVKFCILLDGLSYDFENQKKTPEEIISILNQVKSKIIQRVHCANRDED